MVLPYLHIRCQEYTPNTEGDHLNVTSNNLQHSLYKVGAVFIQAHYHFVISTTVRRRYLKTTKRATEETRIPWENLQIAYNLINLPR